MRNIQDVGNQILECVTSDVIKGRIEKLLYNALYQPPENQYRSWRELHTILVHHYETPFTSDEALEVFVIFTTLTKEQLLAEKEKEDAKSAD